MQWSDIPFIPDRKMLRQFAGLWLVFFGGMALWQALVRGQPNLGLSLGALALVVGLAGLTRPEWVRPIFVGWMVLAFPIGWTVSQVMLLADVLRPVHADRPGLPPHRPRPAPAHPPPGRRTYWTPKPAPADVRRYFHQF